MRSIDGFPLEIMSAPQLFGSREGRPPSEEGVIVLLRDFSIFEKWSSVRGKPSCALDRPTRRLALTHLDLSASLLDNIACIAHFFFEDERAGMLDT